MKKQFLPILFCFAVCALTLLCLAAGPGLALMTDPFQIISRLASNATNVAAIVDTEQTWTNGDLLKLRNHGTNKFVVDSKGGFVAGPLGDRMVLVLGDALTDFYLNEPGGKFLNIYLNAAEAVADFYGTLGTVVMHLSPTSLPYIFGSDSSIASGDLFAIKNNGTNKISGDWQGVLNAVGGLLAVTGNSSAAAGIVGEYGSSAVAFGAAVGMTTTVTTNMTSLSLTAGDWDVEGNVNFSGSSATITDRSAGISTTSVTIPSDGSGVSTGLQTTTATVVDSVTLPRKRISLSATTTVYMCAKATFSAGTVACYGSMTARRVR